MVKNVTTVNFDLYINDYYNYIYDHSVGSPRAVSRRRVSYSSLDIAFIDDIARVQQALINSKGTSTRD